MDNIRFQNRLRQVKKVLKTAIYGQKDVSAALVLSSSAIKPSSRDQDHPFRQNSDFLYLTGSRVHDTVLLVSTELSRPILFGANRSKLKVVWEGPGINLGLLARNIGAEFIETNNIEAEVLKKLQGLNTLYYPTESDSVALKIARKLFDLPSHQRGYFPKHFAHSDLILEPLRVHKDKDEVDAIIEANKVTNTALLCALPLIKAGRTEAALAATIDYSFKLQGAEVGFNSIVAAGKNAATLHHHPSSKKIRAGEMILFDVGAQLNEYCADISRVVPVAKPFSPAQKEIYEIVLAAQLIAISKVKAGVKVKAVYEAATKELCYGLKELGVIKAKVSQIFSKQLYKPFFPHSIGHTLGLDVHDIGNLRGNTDIRLEKGMVITIEPGLYFQKAVKSVPACGVRIEDNVLVTDKGCKILSAGFPKKVKEIEGLFF